MVERLESVLQELRDENSLKTWSVIVTFFGDSIAPRGGAVATSTVQEVMAALGIGSGAVRTALSRLCKDQWMERTRSGRSSFYRLSVSGQQEFTDAATTIYQTPATTASGPHDTVIIIANPDQELPAELLDHSAQLSGPNAWLARSTDVNFSALSKLGHLVAQLENDKLPDWVNRQLLPEHMARRYSVLTKRIQNLAQEKISSPIDALAIRTLLIHEWRRVRLRHSTAAARFSNINSPDSLCHRQVADFYRALNPYAEQWIDTKAQGPHGPLPVSDIEINARFR